MFKIFSDIHEDLKIKQNRSDDEGHNFISDNCR